MRACVEVMTVEMQGVRTLYLAPKVTCTCLIRFSVAYSVLPPIFLLISYFSIDFSSIVLIYLLYLLVMTNCWLRLLPRGIRVKGCLVLLECL